MITKQSNFDGVFICQTVIVEFYDYCPHFKRYMDYLSGAQIEKNKVDEEQPFSTIRVNMTHKQWDSFKTWANNEGFTLNR